MIDRLNESLNFYSQALNLRAERQKALASNIANSDTPGYKARDFDFDAALTKATANRGVDAGTDGALPMATTEAGHLGGKPSTTDASDDVQLGYRNPTQPSLDGNTVDMNHERVQFMDNALHYRADLQILGSQIKGLKAAMEPIR